MKGQVRWLFDPADHTWPVILYVSRKDGTSRYEQHVHLTLDELIEHAAMQLSLAMVMGADPARIVPVVKARLGALANAALVQTLDALTQAVDSQTNSRAEPVKKDDDRGCTVSGCTEPHLARGLCRKHYDEQRQQETSRSTPTPRTSEEPTEYHVKHALDVPCPACHATTGQRCRTSTGNVSDIAHAERQKRHEREAARA